MLDQLSVYSFNYNLQFLLKLRKSLIFAQSNGGEIWIDTGFFWHRYNSYQRSGSRTHWAHSPSSATQVGALASRTNLAAWLEVVLRVLGNLRRIQAAYFILFGVLHLENPIRNHFMIVLICIKFTSKWHYKRSRQTQDKVLQLCGSAIWIVGTRMWFLFSVTPMMTVRNPVSTEL